MGGSEFAIYIQLGCWIAFFVSVRSVPQMVLRMERRIVAFNIPNLLYMVLNVTLALYFVFVLKNDWWWRSIRDNKYDVQRIGTVG